MTNMRIKIDGEVLVVEKVYEFGSPLVTMIELSDGTEWYLAKDSEAAGVAAREYWQDMAKNDPQEFTCMVGKETLVAWALGQYAGPGFTQVKSLADWLDLRLDIPEEHFASWDGQECEVERVGRLREELGFAPTVAYRHN